MLTISDCTPADYADVAALWNAQTANAGSCWYQATIIEASFVPALLATSYAISVARQDGTAVGFGLWSPLEDPPRLVALAAADEAVYYRLMDTYCVWAQGRGATSGRAQVDNRATIERARMDALGAITYTPIGYEPLPPGEDPQTRVPTLFEASSDLQALRAAIAAELEN